MIGRRPPVATGRAGFITILLLASGALIVPVDLSPGVQAAEWITTTEKDFIVTASNTYGCEIVGTGEGARLQINRTPQWWDRSTADGPSGYAHIPIAAAGTGDKLVSFGCGPGNNETWVYDISRSVWEQRTPETSPPGRRDHSVSTVWGRDEVIIFGGESPSYELFNDTWYYDLGDNRWYEAVTAERPTARCSHQMAFLPGDTRLVLFGGSGVWGSELSSTWVFDRAGPAWTRMDPANPPGQRYKHSMAPVGSDRNVVLWGGTFLAVDYCDTWVYDLDVDSWTQKSASLPPEYSGVSWQSMAPMLGDDKVMVYPYDAGMWQTNWFYDLSDDQWTMTFPRDRPKMQGGYEMAAVPGSDHIYICGGDSQLDTDTWFFDPSGYGCEGVYASIGHDSGGICGFTSLCRTATLPPGTHIELRIATADNESNLQSKQCVGPDNTPSTYFADNATSPFKSPGARWVKYLIDLRTSDPHETPVLHDVVIGYDRVPDAPAPEYPPDGGWCNTTTPTLRWRFNDLDSTAQGGFELLLDRSVRFNSAERTVVVRDSDSTTCVPGVRLSDGLWYWTVRTKDSDGCWGPFSEPWLFGIDTVPPEAFVPVADPPGWTSGPCEIKFTTTDLPSGISEYIVLVDGVCLGPAESPYSLAAVEDGARNFTIQACDQAGNRVEGTVRAYLDRERPEAFTPEVSIPGWANSSPQLSFCARDKAGIDRYEVSLDSGPFVRAESPWPMPALADGEHTALIRAYDLGGNIREGSVQVFIDTTSPDVLVVSSSPAGWTNRDPVLTFEASDATSSIDHFEVSVNGGEFVCRTSPYLLTGLAEGSGNVTVRAFDLASNCLEARLPLNIDRTPPGPIVLKTSSVEWFQTNPAFEVSAQDNLSGIDRYEFSTNGARFERCNASFCVTGLFDGSHLITVRAYDRAGNFVEGNATVRMDRTPPGLPGLAINEGATSTANPEVWLSVSAEDSVSGLDKMCFSNDGISFSSWEPFTEHKKWTLSPGTGKKTVYMKVRDKAGNEAETASTSIEYAPARDIPWLAPAIIALCVAMGIAFLMVRHRGRKAMRPPIRK